MWLDIIYLLRWYYCSCKIWDLSSQGYYLDEWLICTLNQVEFGTYVSDTYSFAISRFYGMPLAWVLPISTHPSYIPDCSLIQNIRILELLIIRFSKLSEISSEKLELSELSRLCYNRFLIALYMFIRVISGYQVDWYSGGVSSNIKKYINAHPLPSSSLQPSSLCSTEKVSSFSPHSKCWAIEIVKKNPKHLQGHTSDWLNLRTPEDMYKFHYCSWKVPLWNDRSNLLGWK